MATTTAIDIPKLVLSQLAQREMRFLALTVAVRRTLGPGYAVKGDLAGVIKTSLRQLVSSNAILDSDGVFTVAPRRYPSFTAGNALSIGGTGPA